MTPEQRRSKPLKSKKNGGHSSRIIVWLILLGLLLLALVYRRVSYRPGTLPPLKIATEIEPGEVVAAARGLAGTLYDPLQGRCGNIGGRLGFIVCTDIPVLAYRKAGLSIRDLLAADFKVHPSAYSPQKGNNPSNPYFSRRARNLFAFCQANNRLYPTTEPPLVADVVFYKKPEQNTITHIALVTRVDEHGNYWLMEATPGTLVAQEQSHAQIESRGWTPQGFGRFLPAPTK